MQIEQIESLGLNNKKKTQLIKAMNGETLGLSKKALGEQSTLLWEETTKAAKVYQDNAKNLKKRFR